MAGTIAIGTTPYLSTPLYSSIPLTFYNLTMYGGAVTTSAFNDTVRRDMEMINWNPFNQDEQAVINSTNISFYKGVTVFRFGDHTTKHGVSIVAIGLGKGAQESTLMQEYGHHKQQRLLGLYYYTIAVAIPSYISYTTDLNNHNSKWYEEWATKWGKGGLTW